MSLNSPLAAAATYWTNYAFCMQRYAAVPDSAKPQALALANRFLEKHFEMIELVVAVMQPPKIKEQEP